MTILIVGANGFIGGRVARHLLAAGEQVICCGRNTPRLQWQFPTCQVIASDFTRDTVADWLPRLRGVAVVVNAAGVIGDSGGNPMERVHDAGPQALFQACAQAGVGQVIQISALGADPGGNSRYYHSKGRADAFLASLDPERRHLRWTVIRPSLVIGRGGGSSGLFATLAVCPMMPRLGEGTWRIQPIHVNDLATMVLALVRQQGETPAWIEAAGPEPMTTDQLTTVMRTWLGLPPGNFVSIPTALLRLAARVGDRLPLGPLNSEALAMLMGDNVRQGPAPAGPYAARPLSQALLDEPATRADIREARMEPLRLPLRWGLGLFWILSGALPVLSAESGREGYAMLANMGLTGMTASILLHGASGVDMVLGMMTLTAFQPILTGSLQLFFTLVFSVIILFFLPEYFLHPFGPLTKNIPLLAATLVWMILEA